MFAPLVPSSTVLTVLGSRRGGFRAVNTRLSHLPAHRWGQFGLVVVLGVVCVKHTSPRGGACPAENPDYWQTRGIGSRLQYLILIIMKHLFVSFKLFLVPRHIWSFVFHHLSNEGRLPDYKFICMILKVDYSLWIYVLTELFSRKAEEGKNSNYSTGASDMMIRPQLEYLYSPDSYRFDGLKSSAW